MLSVLAHVFKDFFSKFKLVVPMQVFLCLLVCLESFLFFLFFKILFGIIVIFFFIRYKKCIDYG